MVRGDVWIASLIDPAVITALADGAPIAAVYPDTGVPAALANAFVPAKAPNPAVGKLFVNWLLSEKGQTALQDSSGAPVTRPGVKPPKLVPPNSALKITLSPPPAHARLPAVDAEGVPNDLQCPVDSGSGQRLRSRSRAPARAIPCAPRASPTATLDIIYVLTFAVAAFLVLTPLIALVLGSLRSGGPGQSSDWTMANWAGLGTSACWARWSTTCAISRRPRYSARSAARSWPGSSPARTFATSASSRR